MKKFIGILASLSLVFALVFSAQAGVLTNFTEGKILNHTLKGASYSPPATVYVALSTTTPAQDGTNFTEPTYTGYARKAITFAAAGSRAIAQTGAVTFDACTVGTATVTYWGLYDQLAAGGNLLAFGVITPSKVIAVGGIPSFASGTVSISFNAGAVFTTYANKVLDWLFRAQANAQPTHVKLALSTTTPTDGGPNITEPSGNNYSQPNFDTWNAAASNPRVATNNGTAAFATPSGSWGACTYGVVYGDTNPLFYATITSQTPDNGDTVEYLTGQWSVGVN